MDDLWMGLRYITIKRGESVLAILGTALAVAVLAATISLIGTYDAVFEKYTRQPQARQISVVGAFRQMGEGEAATRIDATAARNARLTLEDAAAAMGEIPGLSASYTARFMNFTTGAMAVFPPGGGPGGLGGMAGMGAGAAPGGANGAGTMTVQRADGGAAGTGAASGQAAAAVGAGSANAGTASGQAAAAAAAAPNDAPPPPGEFPFPGFAEAQASTEPVDQPLLDEVQGFMVTPSYFDAYELKTAKGTLFDDRDVANNTNIAVVGSGLEKKLYEDGNALGKKIRLNGLVYTIGAVLAPYEYGSEGLPFSFDEIVFVPARTNIRIGAAGGAGGGGAAAMVFVGGADELQFAVSSDADLAGAARSVDAFFARKYGEDLFRVRTELERAKSEIDKRKRILSLLAILAGAVGLAAAVNVFNLMTGRVSRRARSIAIQRSLGASSLRVFRQTLAESLMLGSAGAALGALASPSVSGILGRLLESSQTQSFVLTQRWDLIFLVALLSALAAVVFAVPPAVDAAGTVIVDALRDE